MPPPPIPPGMQSWSSFSPPQCHYLTLFSFFGNSFQLKANAALDSFPSHSWISLWPLVAEDYGYCYLASLASEALTRNFLCLVTEFHPEMLLVHISPSPEISLCFQRKHFRMCLKGRLTLCFLTCRHLFSSVNCQSLDYKIMCFADKHCVKSPSVLCTVPCPSIQLPNTCPAQGTWLHQGTGQASCLDEMPGHHRAHTRGGNVEIEGGLMACFGQWVETGGTQRKPAWRGESMWTAHKSVLLEVNIWIVIRKVLPCPTLITSLGLPGFQRLLIEKIRLQYISWFN